MASKNGKAAAGLEKYDMEVLSEIAVRLKVMLRRGRSEANLPKQREDLIEAIAKMKKLVPKEKRLESKKFQFEKWVNMLSRS